MDWKAFIMQVTLLVLLACASTHPISSETVKETTDKSQSKRHMPNGHKSIGGLQTKDQENNGQASPSQNEMQFYNHPFSAHHPTYYSEAEMLEKSNIQTSSKYGPFQSLYPQDYESESSDYDYSEYRGSGPYGGQNGYGNYGQQGHYGNQHHDNDYHGNGHAYHYHYPDRGHTYGYHYYQPYVTYYQPYSYEHHYYEPYSYSYHHSYK